jgi:hypothetical protein
VIDIAVIDPIPVVPQRRWCWQWDDFEAGSLYGGDEFRPKRMIWVRMILLLMEENAPVGREAGDNINVALGAIEKVISP